MGFFRVSVNNNQLLYDWFTQNVFNMLANQKTAFISSRNRKKHWKKGSEGSSKIVKMRKMKNAKAAFWTARQSQTKTFQKLVFKLATIS